MADTKIKEAAQRQQISEVTVNKATEKLDKVLTFYIKGQIYGVEIDYVTEIIGIQPFTKVPGTPNFLKGIINVRSKAVPVIEVRTRFGKEEIAYTDRTCIIIVTYNDMMIGLIVDGVKGVHDVLKDIVSQTPIFDEVNTSRYIKYIIRENDEVRLILDLEKFLED
ncbi:MAG: purine-binding chemotaxis protein CheW [Clostridiales bacterium]|nr:purine-binding chemotaxis protein CheW [Clostridiales bacterium]